MNSRLWAPVRYFVQIFLTGLFTVLPFAVTLVIVMWVAGFLNDLLGPGTLPGRLLESLGLRVVAGATFAYTMGWVLVLATIFVIGLFVKLGAERLLRERVDLLFARLPFLGGVYGTVRQLVGMMEKKEQAELAGMSVVFCLFGGEGGAAFLALLPTPELFRVGEIDYYAVMVPTAPVPVGGSLVFVPAKHVLPANISVDAFMSVYVSMGVTGPKFLQVAPHAVAPVVPLVPPVGPIPPIPPPAAGLGKWAVVAEAASVGASGKWLGGKVAKHDGKSEILHDAHAA